MPQTKGKKGHSKSSSSLGKTSNSSNAQASSSKASSSTAVVSSTAAAPLTTAGNQSLLPLGTIRVGIEAELFLNYMIPPSEIPTQDVFYKQIAEGYNKTRPKDYPSAYCDEIPGTAYEYHAPDYSRWCISADVTIRPEGWVETLGYSSEIISPILLVAEGATWESDVNAMFAANIFKKYDVKGTDTCSTHVHVSKYGGYNLDDLKNIAASALYFEMALDALVPSHRLESKYAHSNWANPSLKNGMTRTAQIKTIRAAKKISDLVELINPQGRLYVWNFQNLISHGLRSTIEFRQPPVITKVLDVVQWGQLAYSFIMAASVFGTAAQLEDFPGSCPPCVGVLQEFVNRGFTTYLQTYGLRGAGDSLDEDSPLQKLFNKDKSGFVKSQIRPSILTIGEEENEDELSEKVRSQKKEMEAKEAAKEAAVMKMADDEYARVEATLLTMETNKKGETVFGNVWAES